ncbi:protein FAM117A-like [Sinocyclocheilus rhinocerous]|uniref:Protein FAM117A-like n=1 Tax=Sinocyclocheilus rhinocerous TaxID=307959 RepID=A0A673LRU4_9TELE|nr:PREDICTED: protein FAM117A-like [Sinocyclocheilus rhinocerous]
MDSWKRTKTAHDARVSVCGEMKMSRSGSGLQPLKATVPFTLHRPVSVTNVTPGERTKAEWRLQTPIQRTVSLDAIVWPYLHGQWPKEDDRHGREDKSTQTPHTWLAGAETTAVGFHKRSASWGNSERLQDGSDVCADSSIFKLKQQLQQKKRSGVLVGKQEKLHNQHQSPALLIPAASLTRLPSRLRRSEERLDQELEKVFTHHSSVHHCGLYEVPDGHRAPVPHLSSKSGFQIGSSCVAFHSSSSSSTSCSPQRPLDLETVEEVNSCIVMVSSSPRPNNSYCFQRDPPEGCERIRVCEENVLPYLDHVYVSSCPDPNKVNFTPHTGSAFCPVNLPKPLLPPVDFLICSLSVSPGSCWVGQ